MNKKCSLLLFVIMQASSSAVMPQLPITRESSAEAVVHYYMENQQAWKDEKFKKIIKDKNFYNKFNAYRQDLSEREGRLMEQKIVLLGNLDNIDNEIELLQTMIFKYEQERQAKSEKARQQMYIRDPSINVMPSKPQRAHFEAEKELKNAKARRQEVYEELQKVNRDIQSTGKVLFAIEAIQRIIGDDF